MSRVEALRERLAAAGHLAHVRDLAAAIAPLTAAQRDRLIPLLRGGS